MTFRFNATLDQGEPAAFRSGGHEVEEAEERKRCIFLAGGEAPIGFEFVEQPLDQTGGLESIG